MKDYTLDADKAKLFIKNYEVLEDNIIIHFATGETFTIPYTEANEQKLNTKMESQILEVEEYEKKVKNNITAEKFWIIVSLLAGITMLAIGYFNNAAIISYIFSSLMGSFTLISGIKLIHNKSIIKDIEKNKYYIDNQELINKGIQNTNVLANIPNKTRSIIESEPAITINTVDKMSYEGLKKVVTSTEYQETFDFECTKEHPKQRIKRR